MNEYFVVVLKDGRVLDFDKMCDSVDYSNNKYVVIKHSLGPTNYSPLAIIGHEEIAMILRKGMYK